MTKKEELIKCSEAIRAALMANDQNALKALYMEDFQGFSLNGDVETLDLILEVYKPGGAKLTAYELVEQKDDVFGEVGIIRGTGYVKGSYGEHEFEHHIRFTDIYLYRNGTWKCYRSHATELAKSGMEN